METIIFDFSRVLLFPVNSEYSGGLNILYKKVAGKPDFNFLKHFSFNNELLEYLRHYRSDYEFYLLTSETIQNDPVVQQKIQGIFKRIISAAEHNYTKDQPDLYRAVLASINKKPEEVIFIDDNPKNIQAARAVGLDSHEYLSVQQVMALLDKSNTP